MNKLEWQMRLAKLGGIISDTTRSLDAIDRDTKDWTILAPYELLLKQAKQLMTSCVDAMEFIETFPKPKA